MGVRESRGAVAREQGCRCERVGHRERERSRGNGDRRDRGPGHDSCVCVEIDARVDDGRGTCEGGGKGECVPSLDKA